MVKLATAISCDADEPTHASNAWRVSDDDTSSGESDFGTAKRTLMLARGVVRRRTASSSFFANSEKDVRQQKSFDQSICASSHNQCVHMHH